SAGLRTPAHRNGPAGLSGAMSDSDGSTVTFRNSPREVRPRAIAAFARKLSREVARGRGFDCVITGDAELRRLNRDFLGQDYATDVLSFPSGERRRMGDIAISSARARAQAREHGHSTEDEIRILMLHGVLHLMGMDHETDEGKMARAEKRWRVRLGLAGGLI